MRKRTTRQLLMIFGGAFFGGLAVFGALASLGRRTDVTSRPAVLVDRLPEMSPPAARAVDAGVPTAPSSESAPVTVSALHVSFSLPLGYRVASVLNAFEASRGSVPSFTVTRASLERERAFVALVKDIAAAAAATEAPAFAPGMTLTLAGVSSADAERSDAALAGGQERFTANGGQTGTRYRRVQGAQTYDSAYLTLPDGSRLVIVMTYAAENPAFDEHAYGRVLASLRYVGEAR